MVVNMGSICFPNLIPDVKQKDCDLSKQLGKVATSLSSQKPNFLYAINCKSYANGIVIQQHAVRRFKTQHYNI